MFDYRARAAPRSQSGAVAAVASSSSSSSSNEFDDDAASNRAGSGRAARGVRPRPQKSSDGPERTRAHLRNSSTSTEDEDAAEVPVAGLRPHDSLLLPKYRDIRKYAPL